MLQDIQNTAYAYINMAVRKGVDLDTHYQDYIDDVVYLYPEFPVGKIHEIWEQHAKTFASGIVWEQVRPEIIQLFSEGALDVAELGRYMCKKERTIYCKHSCIDRVRDLLLHQLGKPNEQVAAFIAMRRNDITALAWQYSGIDHYKEP